MRATSIGLFCVVVGCSGPGGASDAGDAATGRDDAATTDAATGSDAAGNDAAGNDAGATSDAAHADAPALVSGTIVPLYTDPSDPTWPRLVAAATAHPAAVVVAVVNPNDGPTPTVDPAYTSGIAALQAAHVIVVGYVATGYGTRATSAVATDVDRYASQYPTIDGIFFDEAAIYETGHEATYTTESAHARAMGLTFLVANPGTTPDAAYDALFDVALVYESDGAPTAASLAAFASRRTHAGIIPYAVATLDTAYVASVRPDVEYVYLTNDDLPNPWDTLPPYFEDLLAALE